MNESYRYKRELNFVEVSFGGDDPQLQIVGTFTKQRATEVCPVEIYSDAQVSKWRMGVN